MPESYDGFISYSHAADGLLAPRLQSALQRFAKPWWKRRAVRIFRDESSLSANPHLWSSITEALDTSGWFVLLLSPDAARSEWVNQEIAYWVANRDPKKILPVVTDGTFDWQGTDVAGDAVIQQARAPRADHGGIDVGQDDEALPAGTGGHQPGQVAGTAGEIQHLLAGPDRGHVDSDTFPDAVDTERHDIVHEVVAAGDGVEHLAHTADLLLLRDLLEAEMCGLVGHGGCLLLY